MQDTPKATTNTPRLQTPDRSATTCSDVTSSSAIQAKGRDGDKVSEHALTQLKAKGKRVAAQDTLQAMTNTPGL